MLRIACCLIALAACSATYHPIKLVNRTDRAIEAIYIFPTGAADHGASRGALAPDAATTVRVKAGNVDVLAVSAKVKIDDRVDETRTATQTIELVRPLELVFHDSSKVPPGIDRPGTIGVAFRVPATPKPVEEPAPAE
jgi:hypothetical protein